MRKAFLLVFLGLAVSIPSFAFAIQEEETVFRGESVMMTKLVDGKRTERNMIVTISVESSGGKYAASWDAVRISPIVLPSGVKQTSLRAQHYGTDVGTIRNIVVKKDSITFEIVRSFGNMQVTCARKGEFDFDIRAIGTHSSERRKVTYTEEWIMAGNITLPSPSVFGYPNKKPKFPGHQ
jgi:hypothetical protein